jgi:phospholipase D1/2
MREDGRVPMSRTRVLQAGRNCWRIERAQRLSVLIDAAAYFGALRDSLRQADRSIRIVGWDVDSRVEIVADPGRAADGEDTLPRPLGDLLNALARRRRGLRVELLEWDFPMLYAPDRQVLPVYALGWQTHRRVSFCLAGDHPVGASHHQKLVVVDDAVAYVGGIDLTSCRWDTSAHTPDDPRRRTADDTDYPPFHDVQVVLDGAAARALGELVRTRWQRATRRSQCPPPRASADPPVAPWPAHVAPDFEQVDVAIARTEAAHAGRPQVEEVRQLLVDAIGAARRWLYIENQYFSSSVIADVVAERLQAEQGPEIVVVTRRRAGGWLEEATMSVLRARVLERLRGYDRHGRLRVYYPDAQGLDEVSIVVHSKLLVADDRLLIVGSANLNNRSLVLDTECCVALEAGEGESAAASAAIARVRDRLLAEHLGVEADAVAAALRRSGSLVETVEALRGGARTLVPLDAAVPEELDGLVPEAALVDPEAPVSLDRLADELVPHQGRPTLRRQAALLAGFVLFAAAVAAAWRWSPLSEIADARSLADFAGEFAGSPLAPLWVLAAYLVAGLAAVPITLMIVVTALVFGAWIAFGYAMVGSLCAAALTFGIGHALGRDLVGRIGGEGLNRLNRRLGRRGLLAVVTVRILPLAPFTVVNLAAGASHIRLRDFLLGTALGMLPGILAITVFSDRLLAVLREPSPLTLALLAGVAIFVAGGAYALRRWLRGRGDEPAPASESGAGPRN